MYTPYNGRDESSITQKDCAFSSLHFFDFILDLHFFHFFPKVEKLRKNDKIEKIYLIRSIEALMLTTYM